MQPDIGNVWKPWKPYSCLLGSGSVSLECYPVARGYQTQLPTSENLGSGAGDNRPGNLPSEYRSIIVTERRRGIDARGAHGRNRSGYSSHG